MASGRFVINSTYGQLVEGWQAAQAALLQAVQAAGTGIHNAAEIATYAHDRAEFESVIRRCPVFLGDAA